MNNNFKWYFRKYEYDHSFDAIGITELILLRVQKTAQIDGVRNRFLSRFLVQDWSRVLQPSRIDLLTDLTQWMLKLQQTNFIEQLLEGKPLVMQRAQMT